MHDHNAQFGQGNDDWTIQPLATINFPVETDLGGILENEAIQWFRRTYGPNLLLNCNRPSCQTERARARREYMRQWRVRNGQGGPPGRTCSAPVAFSHNCRSSRESSRGCVLSPWSIESRNSETESSLEIPKLSESSLRIPKLSDSARRCSVGCVRSVIRDQ